MLDFECLGDERQNLAEGPVWCPREQALYWVDIRRPTLHRYVAATRNVETWPMPDLVGSLAVRQAGGLLVALRNGLAKFDPETGHVEPVISLEDDKPENRSNDGKCDRRGRFWVGTIHNLKPGTPAGALYRIDASRRVARVAGDIGIPNSIAWSPDDRTMYFADTAKRTIFTYSFDIDSGDIRDRRVFADFPEGSGAPDGSTVDADGFLWNAVYGGSRLNRYAPDGRLDRVVEMPMSQPTSCAFGGRALDVLYVTSAAQRLSAEQLAREPYAGAIIAVDVGVKGLPEPYYAG